LTLRLGTRGSALALAQARWVASRIGADIVEITTAGDLRRDVGDKSRWTGALERALLAGEIDVAVHSAKDVPGELAAGTEIAAVPPREDPRDVLVGAASLDALPAGARVGTSALRRRAQLLAVRPDLDVVELRGNVDTRLRKLGDGEVDALVLAAAGLARLGRGDLFEARHAGDETAGRADLVEARHAGDDTAGRGDLVEARHAGDDTAGRADLVATPLVGDVFVPAPGQGALLVQARGGEARVAAAIDAAGRDSLDDPTARAALLAERAVAARLGASCHTAIGVHAADGLLRAFAGLPDGSEWLIDEVPDGDPGRLAERLLSAGAADLLARAEAMSA
jgi:hydroxymethylbilane synthase